jgi:hypothetical protein
MASCGSLSGALQMSKQRKRTGKGKEASRRHSCLILAPCLRVGDIILQYVPAIATRFSAIRRAWHIITAWLC